MRIHIPTEILALSVVLAARAAAQCPNGTPPPCRTAVVRAAPAPASVAVLPFESRSPDTSQAYLADGMTEEIGNRLVSLNRLQVKPRGVVAVQWRRTSDPLEAARALNVAWFVHGNVRHAGNQVLISVQLSRATTGDEIWGSRFQRSDADLFGVQAEVAESVAAVVGGRLSPAERATIARRRTRNNEAWSQYLLGEALRKKVTGPDFERALAAFTRAVELDPDFADGWARIAGVRFAQQSFGTTNLPYDSLTALCRVAANRALALDSLSPVVWRGVGSCDRSEGDYGRAYASYQRGLKLDTASADLLGGMGYIFDALGDLPAAERYFRRCAGLDPESRNCWRTLANVLRDEGRFAEAEAILDTALAIVPFSDGLATRASIRYARGNIAGARADFDDAGRLSGRPVPGIENLFALAAGDSAPMRAAFDSARTRAVAGGGSWFTVAQIAMLLGRREAAIEALTQLRAQVPAREARCAAATPCSPNLGFYRAALSYAFRSLRGDPRFERMLDETRPRVNWH